MVGCNFTVGRDERGRRGDQLLDHGDDGFLLIIRQASDEGFKILDGGGHGMKEARRYRTMIETGKKSRSMGKGIIARQVASETGKVERDDLCYHVIVTDKVRGKKSRAGIDDDYIRRTWTIYTGMCC